MASIRRHPNARHRWLVRYRDPDGRQRTKNFAKKSDADKFAVIKETDKLRGEWLDPRLGQTMFGDWSDNWMKLRVDLKPKTREGYESLLRVHVLPRFATVPLARITPLDIRGWVAGMKEQALSASRVRQAYHLASSIMRAAVEADYISKTPCVGVALPPLPQEEMRFIDSSEVARLAGAIQEPYGVLVYTMAYGGLRWGEVVALRRQRCQLLRSRLQVVEAISEVGGKLEVVTPKTGRQREVVIPAFLRVMLAEHIAAHVEGDDGLVFTTRMGAHLRNSNFRRRVWEPATLEARLDGLRMHDLRHTAASLLIAEGAHPKAVMAHLGHSTITTTMNTYGHLFPSDQEELADRLDRRHRSHVDRMWTADEAAVVT